MNLNIEDVFKELKRNERKEKMKKFKKIKNVLKVLGTIVMILIIYTLRLAFSVYAAELGTSANLENLGSCVSLL